jgi:hypothetical protein
MRRIMVGIALVGTLFRAVAWWRNHRWTGSRFVNEVVNPFLRRRGVAGRSRENLGTLEHIGRRSGIRRLTMVHPVPTDEGFRIVVPLGLESQWAQNVLAAGHCRLEMGDTVYELDEPAFLEPGSVSEVPAAFRWVQDRLGFRWLRLHRFAKTRGTLEDLPLIAQPSPLLASGRTAVANPRPAESMV